ncbi:MAG: hypothetical protein PHW69_02405 [Elusimicrobiaceae bacterium]|nr:hypothetical protein [Elusimicrobiaceae bacterium]
MNNKKTAGCSGRVSRRAADNAGVSLLIAILIIAVLSVLVPSLVYLARQDSNASQKEQRNQTAYALAEAGANRALLLLRDSTTVYDLIVKSGVAPAGYKFDYSYSDMADSGTYRVGLSSTAAYGEVRVVSTGRDASGREYRTIEVLYTNQAERTDTVVNSYWIKFSGNAIGVWGKIAAQQDIRLSGNADKYFPRKVAGGAIFGRGSNPHHPRTDRMEWWSYNPHFVPHMPAIDFESYRASARHQGHYYQNYVTLSNLLSNDDSAVWFFEKGFSLAGVSHLRGVLIALGPVHISGQGSCADGYGGFTVTPPARAYQEYMKGAPFCGTNQLNISTLTCSGGGDNECWHQYPGDAGYHAVEPFKFGYGCVAHHHLGGGDDSCPVFKGALYVTGQLTMTGQTGIYGMLYALGGLVASGRVNFYLDPSADIFHSGCSSTASMSQTSWRELQPVRF